MKWFDELKAISKTGAFVDGMGYRVEGRTINRLIEIAERAEWIHGLAGFEVDKLKYCSICRTNPHKPTCPYSDEWRKE